MAVDDGVVILDDDLWQELLILTEGEAAPCFQCGVCTAICPWGDFRVEGFNVRSILRAAQLGKIEDLEILWLCSGCLQCEASCPREVPISQVLSNLRYLLWKNRVHLEMLPTTLWSSYWNNNPLGQPPSARLDWVHDIEVPHFKANETEWLLYIGCTASYDRRAQAIAQAAVKLLRSADVSFGILGLDEPCCGESVLRLGHRPFFEEIAQSALDKFTAHKVDKVVTISPHCFDVFINHYPLDSAEIDFLHISQLIAQLVESNSLDFEAHDPLSLTYHDPCLLGRGNGEYDAPRQILQSLPGVKVVAMSDEREDGLCCGGGGGRMFLETPPGERFGDTRVEHARSTGASMVATACPLCIACLEDSMKVVEGEQLAVRDVIEIAADYLRSNDSP